MQIRHVCIFLYIGGGGAQSIACFNERNDTIFLPPARTLTATWCPTPLPLSTSSFASSRWTNDQSKNKTKKLKSYPDTVSGHLSSVGRGFDCLSGRWIKSDKANGSLHSGRFFFRSFPILDPHICLVFQLTTNIPLSAERIHRIRFRDSFDKFIVNVRGFLFVK